MDTNNNTQQSPEESPLRLAIPSDGALYEPAMQFLAACDLQVHRTSIRSYTGTLEDIPGILVFFQRASDITAKVEEGSADLGIVGLDRFSELQHADSSTNVIVENLPFGNCDLVLAVPEGWVDVTTTYDLADLALEFREFDRNLSIATKYPRLVRRFLENKGVQYFALVASSGTLEAAPAMGFADMIADISSTGSTLRENRLKTLRDGVIFSSQACLIGNHNSLARDKRSQDLGQAVISRIKTHLSHPSP